MNVDDFRREMNDYWFRVDREFMDRKESHGALMELMKLYRRFDAQKQLVARQVICEWLRSPEPRQQFDALALVDEFGIVEALPILRELQTEAEERTDHEAPYDWSRINRIIGRLAAPEGKESNAG
ncbi:MAG: hypothetical protein ACRDK3_05045 [Actinomycetota bacterium]